MPPATLEWLGEIPVSTRFDDPYFSLEDGLSETRHVFLAGNGLPGRFRDGFHVAELGFGTGLNLLTTLKAWRDTGQSGRLRFTTFEAFPLEAPEMLRAQAAFPELKALSQELAPFWQQGAHGFDLPDLRFEMIVGDARETLPRWQGTADAWFLDGFSPARNPELWGEALLAEVAGHMAAGGTTATYTAAGHVRRALQAAGLTVARVPGYGRKRHMTIAERP
ncbi:tRNA (5-methylaminomethyl-2-thiouridine)(34)-methyltransferase MnmD [Ponticoccus alexandrii]|uniref:tRNA (5-methylaminomethyl-2-thiouridine)(34)-methyltransferase MnmD n=1 Tax=Ponticoccus alexandrii TaxID=1943633 RepID=A0ABX7F4E9_9RHOB|nr:tRNA (5-methylaminomethyl-2-thiouridine)(34)-methyltransferase MnmD [Ponticoccus alexandrii]ETA52394.1 FAD-dependent oxidoreductase [Rhodobacteraceae bacterium PD-2]QRF65405.1 tRNA (5-methylaminomethyl-2-thiouridine)(34)-methyltransferase MnmD [Ponticoccus alexandrii]